MILDSFNLGLYNILGFLGGSDGKESACNIGDLGSIPGLGPSPGEGKGYPLQYSGLKTFTFPTRWQEWASRVKQLPSSHLKLMKFKIKVG